MIDKISKNKCTGCKACGDICPKAAITYNTDLEGYWYPIIDNKKCINCGLCEKCCPLCGEIKEREYEPKGYAAWNRDNEIRKKSTSGGVYYVLAEEIIREGGYIVGSQYSEDFRKAYHTYGNDEQALEWIMGSKYFQSDTEGIYKKTKELLKMGGKVLFTGAPCQISGLLRFLGERPENLITCDFICRGVPSPKLHSLRIDHYEKKYKSPIVLYKDKDKQKNGWSCFGEKIMLKKGKKIFVNRYKDWFNECFINYSFNMRPSCYNCEFKGNKHIADITIGDFWGVDGVTDKDLRDGVSAIITNTEKGDEFINGLNDKMYLWHRSVQEIAKGNIAYENSINMPEGRTKFFEDVQKMPIKKAIKLNCPENYFKKNLRGDKIIFKTRIKQYKDIIRNWKDISWFKFFRYNFFCKNVKRDKYCFLLPLGKCNIHIEKDAQVILHGNVLLNYYPCYKTNSITNFIVRNNGKFVAENRHEISYANTISVDNGAELKAGYFFTGVGANVICHHKMEIGNNVMLGRDVCLFDSDYHAMYNMDYKKINDDKPLKIGDNVWIGARSMVLKGSVIENNAIIGANSMVTGHIESDRCYIIKKSGMSVGDNVTWRR